MFGGGPSAYFAGDLTTLQNKPLSYWVDDMAATTSRLKAAFGTNVKIIRTIWCQWYNNTGKTVTYPKDDPCIPAGFMTAAMNAMLDAGADGFTVFQSSAINDSTGTLQQRFAERHKEIAEVVKARGNFVGVRHPDYL